VTASLESYSFIHSCIPRNFLCLCICA